MSVPGTGTIALPLFLIALLGAGIALESGIIGTGPLARTAVRGVETVVIPARTFAYRADGEFFRGGYAVDGPLVTMTLRRDLTIMKYQVSAADYALCVAANACAAAEPENRQDSDDRIPVTGISHDDARAYATWLTEQTGEIWKLPSDAELAYAAGSDFPDEKLGVSAETTNPALRWLAEYERQAGRQASADPVPRASGSFGENEYGLADFGGNIWEWTSTCSRRVNLDRQGNVIDTVTSCGIPVASGKHRAALSSFIRNPKGGGCAVGVPPDNLGFRLVRDTRWYAPLLEKLRRRGAIAA